MSSNAIIKVTDRCSRRIRSGHLWVYENEIQDVSGGCTNGDIVSVASNKGRFIAKGFLNNRSVLAVRLLSFNDEEIDDSFIRRRIENALSHRISLGWKMEDSFRVVSSEGDLLPGLIVDKYSNVLSVQFTSLGMDIRREGIIATLKELFQPQAIIERDDLEVRKKEGLPLKKGLIYGSDIRSIEIVQDGLRFDVELLDGHKTGFYLDQHENRKTIKPFVYGKHVLDCFSYTGAFAIYAAAYGAKTVVAVEDSGKVMESLKKNIGLNGFEKKIQAVRADAFLWMREAYNSGKKFDCVILDPPSFVRAKEAKSRAISGYKDINLHGLKLLNDDGILITSSCSQNIATADFISILKDAATDAGSALQLIEVRMQSKDHPILVSMPETHYLNFIIGKKKSQKSTFINQK